ncbi:MAG: NAD(P)-dependent oxidoreductase, partial [Rhodospirillales bacterium]|nr:NAD(P)-dependent oxidoreductase [Rhodospirillales bacterium]
MSGERIGFIGVGAMGEPMCRNLVRKHDGPVTCYDLDRTPLERLAADGARVASSLADLADGSDIVFLSLPAGREVRSVCLGDGGLVERLAAGRTVVDASTVPPALARELAGAFGRRGINFADAPVARTREAAIDGTLSVMVGGDGALLERLRPLLGHIASDVTHCGPVGSGQAVKILNNMI